MIDTHRTGVLRFALVPDADGRPAVFEADIASPHAELILHVGDAHAPAVSVQVRLRHAQVAGDIGLLTVDWEYRRAGEPADDGTATGVVRRDTGGVWRYTVARPSG